MKVFLSPGTVLWGMEYPRGGRKRAHAVDMTLIAAVVREEHEVRKNMGCGPAALPFPLRAHKMR